MRLWTAGGVTFARYLANRFSSVSNQVAASRAVIDFDVRLGESPAMMPAWLGN